MTESKIVERIRKLIALAGNNSSEAEREAALSKAHQMLIEHNLQMSDINPAEQVVEPIGEDTATYKHKAARWSRWICNGIAELYFCKFVWTIKGGKLSASFIGQRPDTQIAHAIAEMVLNSVWREALAYARAGKGCGYSTSTLMTDFTNAAAVAVCARCKAIREQASDSQKQPGTALMVIDLYKKKAEENEAWVNANMKLRAPRKALALKMKNDEAWRAGIKHGSQVSLTLSVK